MTEDEQGKEYEKHHIQKMSRKNITEHLLRCEVCKHAVDQKEQYEPEQYPGDRKSNNLCPLCAFGSSQPISEANESGGNQELKHIHVLAIPPLW